MANFDGIDLLKVVGVAASIAYTIWDAVKKARAKAEEAQALEPQPQPVAPVVAKAEPTPARIPQSSLSAAPIRVAIAPSSGAIPPARVKFAESITELEKESRALGDSVRRERANERFVQVTCEWLPKECQQLRAQVLDPADPSPGLKREHLARASWLMSVLEEIRALVQQRRDPSLLPMLGDADALAEKCYQPLIAFAHAEGLPLRSARPVAQLTEFDLAIWTGFAPTSLAPIFLPRDFFSRIAWWPAIAHEIGHDFLISFPQLRDRLATELGLPGEAVGTLPLQIHPEVGLAPNELWRVHAGWFEELFCDVFGTLMCGPAYVQTMVELFSFTEDPREVLAVPFDERTHRYDTHPPRHLRVHASAMILERAGFHVDAKQILTEWHQRNQLPDDVNETAFLFFANGQWVYVPYEAVAHYTKHLVHRLYAGPLGALNGFGLQSISGLDYGPHERQESERAEQALLKGLVPTQRDPRAVIAGAVWAVKAQPHLEAKILENARRAINGVGTGERAAAAQIEDFVEDAPSWAVPADGSLDTSPLALREAVMLREIMRRRSA